MEAESPQTNDPQSGLKRRRFFGFKSFKRFLDASDYSLPLEAWNATTHVLTSIFCASFCINLLSLAFPLSLLQVYDRIIPNNAMSTLTLLIVGVGCALLLEIFFRIGRSYVGAWADSKFEHITGCRAFTTLIESSLLDYEKEGSGIHLKRMNALGMLREYYAGQALISIADIPFVIVLFLVIGYIAGWIVCIPIIVVIAYIFLTIREAKKLQNVLQERYSHEERRFNFIIETLGNIHTVKSVTMEAQMQRRYERLQKVSAIHDYELSLKGSTSTIAGVSVSQLMVILIVALGSMLVVRGQLTIGGLAACTLLSGRCLQPINLIVGLWTRLQTIKIANDELKILLSMKRECNAGLPEMPKCKGAIEIKNVNFRYEESNTWIFKDLNLSIAEKQTIGIAGKGQSGKSTLIWLLMGLFQPNDGHVCIDNQDISNFQCESVRRQIAYLPQKAVLFKGTIMENLTMFKTKELFDYAKKICNVVGIGQAIERLPKGYDTMLGDQTIDTLSRGMNQRIAIARAIIQNPRIIIFDEANTALDMQSDAHLRKMLEQLKGQRTMILVTHRPSILSLADTVYEITNGQMKEVNGRAK